MSKCSIVLAAVLGMIATSASDTWAQEKGAQGGQVFKFDNLSHIGGMTPKVEGSPQLVDSPVGKAVQFKRVAQHSARRNNDRSFDQVLQFTNISGP